ncbi:MAG TPA: SDR family NAD(P)-dependent oxidoreductase, partial [Spirochaetia bacterium]|nr:SDR family NAD(P)-dependent oxidoreductase [Spirochaetia bacterium]
PTMLISGGDTPLGNSVIQKALADGFNVVATAPSISNQGQRNNGEKGRSESLMLVPWSRLSPVSARNVVLRAIASYGAIDQAIMVHSLTNERKMLHEITLNRMQEIVDVQLKSHLFLAKEILSHFLKRKAGVLSLVVDAGAQGELPTMDSLVTQGFIALAKSLMSTYRNEPIIINGFESQSNDVKPYADFIIAAVSASATAGKWYHLTEKSGLFRGRSSGKH